MEKDKIAKNLNNDELNINNIQWIKSIGTYVIENIKLQINGNTIYHTDSNGNAIITHENIEERDCYVCKSQKNKISGINLQRAYGLYHKYDKKNDRITCHMSKYGLMIDYLTKEFIEISK